MSRTPSRPPAAGTPDRLRETISHVSASAAFTYKVFPLEAMRRRGDA
jgi:hypothetical protein